MADSSPRVELDREADCLYVTFADTEVARTARLDELRMIDYASDGTVVGVEFVGVSGGIDLQGMPHAEEIDRLISDSGHSLKILA